MKPSGLSGSPWLIGIWRFRPLVRMVDRCAAPLMTASSSASARPVRTASIEPMLVSAACEHRTTTTCEESDGARQRRQAAQPDRNRRGDATPRADTGAVAACNAGIFANLIGKSPYRGLRAQAPN